MVASLRSAVFFLAASRANPAAEYAQAVNRYVNIESMLWSPPFGRRYFFWRLRAPTQLRNMPEL